MTSPAGTVTLTTVGQQATASIWGFDQNGDPMPADFTMPAITFTSSDTAGAVIDSQDNGDGTDTVMAVAGGTATLTASCTTAEGLALTATGTVTVATAPFVPVLTTIVMTFTPGATVTAATPAPAAQLTPNQKLAAAAAA